jgi:hypothetical protein
MAKAACSTSPDRTKGVALFLRLSETGDFQLEDRENFRAFRLVIEAGRDRLDEVRRVLAGKAELPDADMAWIFEDTLRRLTVLEHDRAWQQNLSAMTEKARPHGWIDDARKAIEAHVEWAGA